MFDNRLHPVLSAVLAAEFSAHPDYVGDSHEANVREAREEIEKSFKNGELTLENYREWTKRVNAI